MLTVPCSAHRPALPPSICQAAPRCTASREVLTASGEAHPLEAHSALLGQHVELGSHLAT